MHTLVIMCVDSDRAEYDNPQIETEKQNGKPGANVGGEKTTFYQVGDGNRYIENFLLNSLLYIPSILKHSVLK